MRFRTRSGLVFAILVEGGLLGLAVLLGQVLGLPTLERLRVQPMSVILGTLATVPLLAVLTFLLQSRAPALRRLIAAAESLLGPFFKSCSFVELAIVAALAGVGEEALFRGVLQTWGTEALGPALGIGLTSIVFGLAHFVTPLYAFLAAAIGTYIGVLYYVSGDLLAVMLVHGLYDLVALEILVRRVRVRM